jgi:radical SAM-linked protein
VREQPEQQAPPVQRLRVRYAKRGRLRFTSHRDFSRAFERALVRARIPMAYSSGFNPHPRISYAGAAPTGSASEAEYLEIGLAARRDPAEVRRDLAAAMPVGLDVLAVAESPGGALAALLTASRWRIDTAADPEALAEAVSWFLETPSVRVERMTKKGMREFDCRVAVHALSASGSSLDLVLEHTVPAVRPDDVLTGLRQRGLLSVDAPPLLTRVEQGVLDEASGGLSDPLA